MITVVAVGCGDRTTTYLEVGVHVLKKMKVVAAIDPNPERLRYMQEHFDVPAEACFRDMYEVLSQGRIAELFGVTASFKENTFKAHLSETAGNNQPLFVNKATKLTQEKNEIQGF